MTDDVVNLIRGMIKNGEVKSKGRYEYLDFEKMGWAKNHSAMVIPLSVMYHLLGFGDYEEFIRLHDNKYDFCLRTKVPRSSSLVLVKDGEDIEQQNICRYYPCKDGGKLVKLMPPLKEGGEIRRMGIDTEYLVSTCNDMNDFGGGIDYSYYTDRAWKLIEAVSKIH